jgi:hypothetical protein
MFWRSTESTGQGSPPPPFSGSMPATHDPPALDTIPRHIAPKRIDRGLSCPPRPQGTVARIIPLYTLYVRPQKTRIQAQDELRGTVMMRIVTDRLSPLEDRRGARRNEMTACDDRFEQRTDLPTRSRGST